MEDGRSWGELGGLRAVGEAELQHALPVHLVEQLELRGQLMGLLPFGGELGALLVVIVVGEFLACVWVPAEGPESIQVDALAHGGGQRVHQDTGAEALRRQLLGFPVAVEDKHNTTGPVGGRSTRIQLSATLTPNTSGHIWMPQRQNSPSGLR